MSNQKVMVPVRKIIKPGFGLYQGGVIAKPKPYQDGDSNTNTQGQSGRNTAGLRALAKSRKK